jgi:hypothetical protein
VMGLLKLFDDTPSCFRFRVLSKLVSGVDVHKRGSELPS